MLTSNFHTHSLFCDGKNSPEEMVQKAIEIGFSDIGFSSHLYSFPERKFSLQKNQINNYIFEIKRLRDKYKSSINIYCGVEKDYFSLENTSRFDYVIGSVHFVYKDNEYLPIDTSPEITEKIINNHFNGSYNLFAKKYYEMESQIVNKTNCDIIGHFDLITKFDEISHYKHNDVYYEYAQNAVKKLVLYNKPFEINTGAISRGYRTSAYPEKRILEMIKNYGGKIMFSSDCHDKNYLNCEFENVYRLALSIGFKEYGIVTPNGISYIKMG